MTRAGWSLLAILLLLSVPALPAESTTSARPGIEGPTYPAGVESDDPEDSATSLKTESKLWHHDGSWWASIVVPSGAHSIHRLDGRAWVDTGVVLDPRARVREDVLSDGDRLYVLIRDPLEATPNRLARLTYTSGTYGMDPGFPVEVPGEGEVATTIARDGAGRLWMVQAVERLVMVASTQGDDRLWNPAEPLPFEEARDVRRRDVAAVVAFSDDLGPGIGVLWSNEERGGDFFAIHRDGDPPGAWAIEAALSGEWEVDDHVNLAVHDGNVYAAVKTAETDPTRPQIVLLRRHPNGGWTSHVVASAREQHTRPIVVVDGSQRIVHVMMAGGTGVNAGGIQWTWSDLDDLAFDQPLSTLIAAQGLPINNPTSTKQAIDGTMGLVVLASGGGEYWFNRVDSQTPANQAPRAGAVDLETLAGEPLEVDLWGSDIESCELVFEIVAPPEGGTIGAGAERACRSLAPHLDRLVVTYRPDEGFVGTDRIVFRVGDGDLVSPEVEARIHVHEAKPVRVTGSSTTWAHDRTLDLVVPSGARPGDLLVAAFDVRGEVVVSQPAGWALVRSDSLDPGMSKHLFIRHAIDYEPGIHRFVLSRQSQAVATLVSVRGVDGTDPLLGDLASEDRRGFGGAFALPIVEEAPDAAALDLVGAGSDVRITRSGTVLGLTDVAYGEVGQTLTATAGMRAGSETSQVSFSLPVGTIVQTLFLRPSGSPTPDLRVDAVSRVVELDGSGRIWLAARGDFSCEDLTFEILQPPIGELGPMSAPECEGPGQGRLAVEYVPPPEGVDVDTLTYRAVAPAGSSPPATIRIDLARGPGMLMVAGIAAAGVVALGLIGSALRSER